MKLKEFEDMIEEAVRFIISGDSLYVYGVCIALDGKGYVRY